MEASKCADFDGLLPGHAVEQADAEQAYTQSELGGTKTWVRLPREQWPEAWVKAGYRDPVWPLILSLYGHPDAGGYWEEDCDKRVRAAGFKPISEERPSCYFNSTTGVMLVVYVDDFKASGPPEAVSKMWKE